MGAENQLTNRTYLAVIPAHCAEWISSTITSVAFRRAWRRLLPARDRPSYGFPHRAGSCHSLRKAECCKALPVDPRIIQETVDGVFRELPSKCAGHHLHVDTPVREHHTEEAAEDIHDRDPLFLSNITLEEKTPDVEPFHKFCSKI